MTQTAFPCPHCGKNVDVSDILARRDDELKKQYADEADIKAQKIAAKEIAAKEAELQDNAQKIADQKFAEQKAAVEARVKKEMSNEMASKDAEIKEKSAKIQYLAGVRAEKEKLKRALEEQVAVAKADKEEAVTKSAAVARENERQKYELKLREKDLALEEQKRITGELQRKQEQGSVQRQGEAQELAIEEWLLEQFPEDSVVRIKKGQRGADCLQTVRDCGHICGTICYESKRTKNFLQDWIGKFKEDIREKGADIGVMVTSVLPLGMERCGKKDGVWVCTFEEFKGVSVVLRDLLIKINSVKIVQENKGDKAAQLYDYLTSNEFALRVEAIVEGFSAMKTELESEKRAMLKIWAKREKQIEVVINNTVKMHGSIQGIGGGNIKDIPLLEFSVDDTGE